MIENTPDLSKDLSGVLPGDYIAIERPVSRRFLTPAIYSGVKEPKHLLMTVVRRTKAFIFASPDAASKKELKVSVETGRAHGTDEYRFLRFFVPTQAFITACEAETSEYVLNRFAINRLRVLFKQIETKGICPKAAMKMLDAYYAAAGDPENKPSLPDAGN